MMTDVFPAGATFVETLRFSLGEFNGTRGEDYIRGKSTASFYVSIKLI